MTSTTMVLAIFDSRTAPIFSFLLLCCLASVMAGPYPLPLGVLAAALGAATFLAAGAFFGAAAFASVFAGAFAFTTLALAWGAAVFFAGLATAWAGAPAAVISRSRRMVNMRARSLRRDRSFLMPSAWPI